MSRGFKIEAADIIRWNNNKVRKKLMNYSDMDMD
jgi:hypothetical protein